MLLSETFLQEIISVSSTLVGLAIQILFPVGTLLSEICGLVSIGRPL
jgi:hypothetical protein